MSFNGIARRVLLSLFQQSYKGFKGKFFKIRCSKFDPTLLDGFPLYSVKEPELKKPRCLEDLTSRDREVCEFVSNLGVVFSTAEKRRQFVVVALQLRVAPGPFAVATSPPSPSAPVPVDQRQKGVVEVAASKDEDTCSGLVFKKKRKVDVVIPVTLGSDDRAPSFREHPPSASCPCDLVLQEGRGESASGAIAVRLMLTGLPSSNGPCNPSKIRRGWRTWRRTPY